MEWNEAESDLTAFGQSVAVEQFIVFLKRSDAYFGPGELASFIRQSRVVSVGAESLLLLVWLLGG
jgi:hypothetical protein